MTHHSNAITHAGPGPFKTWLTCALYRHRVWLGVNLAGMTVASVAEVVGDRMDPYATCFPGPLGGSLYGWLSLLLMLNTWTGNTVALLIGLLRLRDNSFQKRLTLLALWVLTPVCWILFFMAAAYIASPDCCQFAGAC